MAESIVTPRCTHDIASSVEEILCSLDTGVGLIYDSLQGIRGDDPESSVEHAGKIHFLVGALEHEHEKLKKVQDELYAMYALEKASA